MEPDLASSVLPTGPSERGAVVAELLPADPARGLDRDDAEQAAHLDRTGSEGRAEVGGFGMHTITGELRLARVVEAVESVLAVGLGREVALATLHGLCGRLLRDGHPEWSDTVVREGLAAALTGACEAADVEAFTDDEIGEPALLVSAFSIEAAVHATRTAMAEQLAAYLPQADEDGPHDVATEAEST